MNFVLPLRPSRPSKGPKTLNVPNTTRTPQPPPASPRRRPSLATRSGVVKRRSSVSANFNAPTMSFFEAMFGDDFPGTFALDDGRSCKSKRTIFDLPSEILEIIYQTLSSMDIKRLRLTNRMLAETVELRIDRVFISPNRANLDCLSGVLNHPRYCLRVQEIIWDDSQLDEYLTLEKFRERLESDQEKAKTALEDHLSTPLGGEDHGASHESIGIEDCIDEDGSLTHIGKAILLGSDDKRSADMIASHAASMSIEDSYALYQKLYQDEKEIIKRAWDVAGLQRALTQLPNLRRITLTSEIWRPWIPIPTYDTPFFRALPAGFRKPSVWPWICCHHSSSVDPPRYNTSTQRLSAKWRGYSIIMALLVSYPVSNLQEFVIDTGQETIGLPQELFALPNIDFRNTIQVLSTASLKKFQFSLVEQITGLPDRDFSGALSVDIDLLEHVISVMPHLEFLDLKWRSLSQHGCNSFPGGFLQQSCPRLKHLSLRYTKLTGRWLYDLIVGHKSLETVVLDKVEFIDHGPDSISAHEEVFSRLREHYASMCLRGPKFTWIEHITRHPTDRLAHTCTHWVVIDEELDAFLYDGAISPWLWESLPSQIQTPKDLPGWIMDGRNSSFSKRRSEALSVVGTRNPWPTDCSMSNVHHDWRTY
ncbi:hypothetical protein OPT61_g2135 [Boeremia exigua]|uniref:Uncharacterized protein n=1 Tax=Boeremia exigua TaxID=749465 RepID=A0ACC2IML9_9PLEO|nr:hypothetical protein OPT61_g2135 [Boeremia exigua]